MGFLAIIPLFFAIIVVGLILKKLFGAAKIPSLSNKHIVVTGGSSGIGKAVAIEAAKCGADVTIIARDVKRLDKAKEEILKAVKDVKTQKITVISLDLTKSYEEVEKVIKALENDIGPIYALINCAGMAVCGKIEDTSASDFQHMMNLNYYGTVFPTKAVVESMKKRQEGHIVITGSQASMLGIIGLSAYCASKFALRGFAESLYMELLPYNVYVTMCLPPDTNTPGFENEQKSKPIETKLITETAGLFEPDVVAKQLLSDTFGKSFVSSVGFEGYILTTLCTGMGPLVSVSDVIQQITLMSLLRLVSVGYIINFQRIINHYTKVGDKSSSVESKKEN